MEPRHARRPTSSSAEPSNRSGVVHANPRPRSPSPSSRTTGRAFEATHSPRPSPATIRSCGTSEPWGRSPQTNGVIERLSPTVAAPVPYSPPGVMQSTVHRGARAHPGPPPRLPAASTLDQQILLRCPAEVADRGDHHTADARGGADRARCEWGRCCQWPGRAGRSAHIAAQVVARWAPRGVVEVGIPASSGWAWSIAAMSSRSGLSIFAPVHPSTRLAILPGRVGRFTKRSC
jgi:hypothetical protein